ncbi:superoxide dismutase family protein [Variovorax boronicumulans]|uniref:superoxide dismutase family protein n=1 Tax=Variovorax boronicumulans TaxID=436515 RepID=UPI001C5758BB
MSSLLSSAPLRCAMALAVASTMAACANRAETVPPATTGPMGALAPTGPAGIARLLTPGGQPAGQAVLTPVAGGVDVQVTVQGLSPGAHGLHVHANGACAPGPDAATGSIVDFGAAGGHFDPGASHNHGQPGQPAGAAHAGELPALQVTADGRGTVRFLNPNLTLSPGPMSAMGRTVVVHADPDDYQSDPAGNSGARILCGLIEPGQGGIVQGRATIEGAQVFPEGIAVDPRTGTAYVGSTTNGDLFRIARGATKAELFQAGGSPGRMGAFGMKVDDRGRLWIAGGPNGTIAIVDLATATTLTAIELPKGPQTFVNDLVVSRDGAVYATDSFRPVIYRIRNVPSGGTLVMEPWLDLSSTPVRYVPNEVNLNGLVASPDGRWLLSVQLSTGQLWRIDTQTKAVAEVGVDGGPLKNGDGLVLSGASDLLVMRNVEGEIVHLKLAAGWGRAQMVQRHTDSRLRYPTTAAVTADGLMVVNAQLDKQKSPPPLLPFDIVTVRLPGQ